MSVEKDLIGTEDLDVAPAEAEAIAGGSASLFTSEQDMAAQVFRLESQGYVAQSCTTEGTLYRNPQTGATCTVGLKPLKS